MERKSFTNYAEITNQTELFISEKLLSTLLLCLSVSATRKRETQATAVTSRGSDKAWAVGHPALLFPQLSYSYSNSDFHQINM